MTSLENSNLKQKKKSIKNKIEVLQTIKESNDQNAQKIRSSILTSKCKKSNIQLSTQNIEEEKIIQDSNKKSDQPTISRSGRIRRKVKSSENPLTFLIKNNKTDNANKKIKVGCNCTNTKCIQMYCRCFKNGTYCNSKCKCQGCLNKSDNSQIRKKLKTMLVDEDKLSFINRFKTIEVSIIDKNGAQRVEGIF